MIVSSTEITLSREVGEGRVRVEEDPENYDDEKNFFRCCQSPKVRHTSESGYPGSID
jgi:hypothetical protein